MPVPPGLLPPWLCRAPHGGLGQTVELAGLEHLPRGRGTTAPTAPAAAQIQRQERSRGPAGTCAPAHPELHTPQGPPVFLKGENPSSALAWQGEGLVLILLVAAALTLQAPSVLETVRLVAKGTADGRVSVMLALWPMSSLRKGESQLHLPGGVPELC